MHVGMTEAAIMSLMSRLADARQSSVYAAAQVAISLAFVVGLYFVEYHNERILNTSDHVFEYAQHCNLYLHIIYQFVYFYVLCVTYSVFLQGVSGSCKPCTSYDRDVCRSVRLSVRHTLVLSENDAS